MAPFTRSVALLAGPLLVAAIAVADYLTGYEVRLAVLYLVPIALVTWAAGAGWGLALSATATGTWLVSFQSMHLYTRSPDYRETTAISR